MKSKLIIVTGISGSGKSIALKTFEDSKFEAVDNIPLSIIPSLLQNSKKRHFNLAIGLDIRNRDFDVNSSVALIEKLRQDSDLDLEVIFVNCEDDILIRRYSENRRSHPIGSINILEAIQKEKDIMDSLKKIASYIIDTSNLSVIDLRKILKNYLKSSIDQNLLITLKSFSYKQGIPRESDLVFDVRFLKNPYYEKGLKDLDGRSILIKEYFVNNQIFNEFMERIKSLILFLLPHYQEEGKSYLTISIGCTGGKHRSVLVAELLTQFLREQCYKVNLLHKGII